MSASGTSNERIGVLSAPIITLIRKLHRETTTGCDDREDRAPGRSRAAGKSSRAGLDSARYAGHSLRAGHAAAAAIAGASERSIMNQTGHRPVQMAISGKGACSGRIPRASWGCERWRDLPIRESARADGCYERARSKWSNWQCRKYREMSRAVHHEPGCTLPMARRGHVKNYRYTYLMLLDRSGARVYD